MGYTDYSPIEEKHSFQLHDDKEAFDALPLRPVNKRRSYRTILACTSAFLTLLILFALGAEHGEEIVAPLAGTYLTRLAAKGLPHAIQDPTDGLTTANFTKVDPSKILILQVDNRDLTPYLQTGNQAVNFSSIPFYANSVLANVLYAQRYGYQYERLEAIVPQDVQYRHITWWKMPAIRKALEKYEIVLFLDSDALIYDQTYSIHDLMVRWGMHDKISLCASTDYWVNWHINTGVMMFRRSDMAFEILDTLIACPEDPKSGCATYRDKPYHEQTALNQQLRPKHPYWREHMALAPCQESLGGPHAYCKGTIIRHEAGYTNAGVSYKVDIVQDVATVFSQTMLGLLRARIDNVAVKNGTQYQGSSLSMSP